jgi:hypothetical protein
MMDTIDGCAVNVAASFQLGGPTRWKLVATVSLAAQPVITEEWRGGTPPLFAGFSPSFPAILSDIC